MRDAGSLSKGVFSALPFHSPATASKHTISSWAPVSSASRAPPHCGQGGRSEGTIEKRGGRLESHTCHGGGHGELVQDVCAFISSDLNMTYAYKFQFKWFVFIFRVCNLCHKFIIFWVLGWVLESLVVKDTLLLLQKFSVHSTQLGSPQSSVTLTPGCLAPSSGLSRTWTHTYMYSPTPIHT